MIDWNKFANTKTGIDWSKYVVDKPKKEEVKTNTLSNFSLYSEGQPQPETKTSTPALLTDVQPIKKTETVKRVPTTQEMKEAGIPLVYRPDLFSYTEEKPLLKTAPADMKINTSKSELEDARLAYLRQKRMRENMSLEGIDKPVELPADYKEPTGFADTLVESLKRSYYTTIKPAIGGFAEIHGQLIGNPEMIQWGEKFADKAATKILKNPELLPAEDIEGIFSGGIKDPRMWGKTLGELIPFVSTVMASSLAGGLVAGPAGASVGAYAATYAVESANAYRRYIESGAAPDKASVMSSIYGAISSKIENSFGIMPSKIGSAVFGKTAQKTLSNSFKNFVFSELKNTPLKTLKIMAEEGGEEVAQQFAENLGMKYFDKNTNIFSGLMQSLEGGVVGGLAFGGMAAVPSFVALQQNIKAEKQKRILERVKQTTYKIPEEVENIKEIQRDRVINKAKEVVGDLQKQVNTGVTTMDEWAEVQDFIDKTEKGKETKNDLRDITELLKLKGYDINVPVATEIAEGFKSRQFTPAYNIEDDLLQEAKKYKSVEEFVAANNEIVYHRTNYNNARAIQKEGLNPDTAISIKDGKKSIFLTGDEQYAKSYAIQKGGNTNFVLAIRKPLDATVEQSTFKKGMKFPDIVSSQKVSPNDIFIKGKDNQWYAIKEFNFFMGEPNTFIGKTPIKNLQEATKPQLTDIWNKAQEKYNLTESKLNSTQQEAFTFINKMFPLGDVKLEIKDQVLTENGFDATGKSIEKLIEVVENKGKISNKVLYHEAFHTFLRYFVNQTEYEKITDFIIKEKNNDVQYKKAQYRKNEVNLTDRQAAEEILADDFANYVATRETVITPAKGMFARLLAFIKKIINNKPEFNSLFEEALSGKRKQIKSPIITKLKYQKPKGASYNVSGKEQLAEREAQKQARQEVTEKRQSLVFDDTELENQYQSFKDLKIKNAEDVDQLKLKNKDATPNKIDNMLYSQDKTGNEVFYMFKERYNKEKESLPQVGKETKAIVAEKIRQVEKTKAREARTNLLNKLREKQKDIKLIQSDIIAFAKSVLPLNERGKILSMIKNSKTQRDYIKAFSRIDKMAKQAEKKTLINDLKNTIKKINKSQNIAIDYKIKINQIIDTIQIAGKREATLIRLKNTKKYIENQKAKGKDVTMPETVINTLKILERKPILEMSNAEISNLIDQIDLLDKLGKTKKVAIDTIYNNEKEEKLQKVINELKPLEKHELIKPLPGEEITIKQKFKNIFPRFLNTAQHIDLAITPMDVFFDMIGGGDGSYTNTPYRIFKQTTDTNYQAYLQQKDRLIDEVWKKADELNLHKNNFEKIGIHAAKVQKDGIEKLIATGLTLEQINSIELNTKEKELYNLMRKNLDDLREPIAEIMRLLYNKELGKVENYFSFVTDWKAMTDTEVYQRIGEGVEEIGKPTKNVEQGFTIERTKTGKGHKIKLDAMEIYTKHIDNVAYLLNMARDNKMLYEIANSPEFGEAAGDLGQRITLEWIDLISRKGGKAGDQKIAILDSLRRNIGIAYLGFKLSSAIIQPTALLDGATLIDGWVFKGMQEVIINKDVRKFIFENMPEIRDRVADDPAFLEQSEFELMAKTQQAGYAVLKYLDGKTASAVAWGAYLKKIKELKTDLDLTTPNKEAIEYAQKIVRRTQASSIFKDAPLAISKGKLTGNRSFDRAFLQFQNFMLNRWSLIRHDAYRAGIKSKNWKNAFATFFWLTLAILTEEGLRRASKELIGFITGEEPEHYDEYNKAVAMQALTTVPFVSQLVSMGSFGGDPVPSFGAIRDITKGVANKDLIKLLEGAGEMAGVPGSKQIGQVAKDLTKKSATGKGKNNKPQKPSKPKKPSK